MKCVAFALLCAACVGDDAGPAFPVEPGTNGSAATAGTTGGATGDGGTALLRGRVCVVEDIRFQNSCASSGASGLAVSLGTQTAITNEDGSFAMPPPPGTGLSFTVTGPGLVTTSQALNARAQINAIRQSTFDEMVLATGITPGFETGSIIATVTQGGVAAAGVSATSKPTAAFGPFFDGLDPMPWTTNATGTSGIVWFPGLVAGPAELSFNTLTGGSAIVGGVQVINGGVTMVETPLP